MWKKFLFIGALLISFYTEAQKKDTVIVNLAKTSQIIFTVEDENDLEILKHYDFQKLFEHVLQQVKDKKTDQQDSTAQEDSGNKDSDDVVVNDDPDGRRESEDENDEGEDEDDDEDEPDYDNDDNDDNDDDHIEWHSSRKWSRTWQTFNFDLGTNNYLQDGDFPGDNEGYSVRPWGSWYIGLSSVQRSRLGKKVFLEWGLGMSWYNFKFQDDNTIIAEDDNGTQFTADSRDVNFIKSKLTVSYIHASLIPVIDFGDNGRKPRFWDGYEDSSFRIGLGPYIGYRVGSHSKIVYNDDGDKERDKDRDGFNLNNFRYGARLQVGYRSTDLFFNYDLNELFQENRGPKLNAFSFGVIF
jgi:hypothetical protein